VLPFPQYRILPERYVADALTDDLIARSVGCKRAYWFASALRLASSDRAVQRARRSASSRLPRDRAARGEVYH